MSIWNVVFKKLLLVAIVSWALCVMTPSAEAKFNSLLAGASRPTQFSITSGDGNIALTRAHKKHLHSNALPQGFAGYSKRRVKKATKQIAHAWDGVGNFRTVCSFSHMSYDDPIVFPRQPGASHLHVFFGNTRTSASSTTKSLRLTGNSTCRGGIVNRTAYWVPALLDRAGNPIPPDDSHFYYKGGYFGIQSYQVRPMPKGLRMIAGDQKSTKPQSPDIVTWKCFERYTGRSASIADVKCKVGEHLALSVQFPQCWDGKRLDSPDHRSHMAYPQAGKCPSSHPVAIPAISYSILYKIKNTGALRQMRLASDMYSKSKPGGYSAHADWFDGWDEAVKKTFVERCIRQENDCMSELLGDGRSMY